MMNIYHICNEDDNLDINLVKNYGILYCPEEKKFVGYWDSPNLYYFEIQVFFCENGAKVSKNNNCTSIEILRNFLKSDSVMVLGVLPVLESVLGIIYSFVLPMVGPVPSALPIVI